MARFEEQKLYIGGRYVEATSGATFETINPANGEVLANVQRASKDDVERAVASAVEGQTRVSLLVSRSALTAPM